MGEAVRISYRGQTLNNKNGYKRSGLSRLVIEEKEEETLQITQTEDQPDPIYIRRLENWRKKDSRQYTGNPK